LVITIFSAVSEGQPVVPVWTFFSSQLVTELIQDDQLTYYGTFVYVGAVNSLVQRYYPDDETNFCLEKGGTFLEYFPVNNSCNFSCKNASLCGSPGFGCSCSMLDIFAYVLNASYTGPCTDSPISGANFFHTVYEDFDVTYCATDKAPIYLRVVSTQESFRVTFKEFNPGEPNPIVFEIPSGCKCSNGTLTSHYERKFDFYTRTIF